MSSCNILGRLRIICGHNLPCPDVSGDAREVARGFWNGNNIELGNGRVFPHPTLSAHEVVS